MKIEQKVVRLSINSKSISNYIKDGWRVVIVTPIITGEIKYIEYILEREVDERLECTI